MFIQNVLLHRNSDKYRNIFHNQPAGAQVYNH